MKKVLSTALAASLMLGAFGAAAYADETEHATVYVSIADDKGVLVLTQEAINVTDVDADGALTINDALYAAHEAKFDGGADAGYASSMGPYGLALDKLWGVTNGGSYGYMLNNSSAMGLTDPIKDGDHINAYAYTDLITWSDTYCYFDAYTVEAEAGKAFTLTLSASGYDESWNPITLPVEGAEITIDGEKTGVKTDTEGKATVMIDTEGTFVLSALSDRQTLVPPVCKISVTAVVEVPETEDNTSVPPTGDANIAVASIFVVSVAGVAVCTERRKYEE